MAISLKVIVGFVGTWEPSNKSRKTRDGRGGGEVEGQEERVLDRTCRVMDGVGVLVA